MADFTPVPFDSGTITGPIVVRDGLKLGRFYHDGLYADMDMYVLGRNSGIYVIGYLNNNKIYAAFYSREAGRIVTSGITYNSGTIMANNYISDNVSDFYRSTNATSYISLNIDVVSSLQEADSLFAGYSERYPITYRLTNASIDSAPTEAAAGEIVNASFTFPEGYGIVNTSSDIYVTNDGVVIPSSYSNGVLTFTMPDPNTA